MPAMLAWRSKSGWLPQAWQSERVSAGHFNGRLEALFDEVFPKIHALDDKVTAMKFLISLQEVKAEINRGAFKVGGCQ